MIEVDGLVKRYGDAVAVDGATFSVDDGVICGLLGPNGAGKSTTMNIMTGCLAATAGTVRYDGLDIYEDGAQVKRRIGYLPEMPPVYPDMTVSEYLRFVGAAKGLSRMEAESECARTARECGLADVPSKLVKALSKGYRQRVGIAQALIGSPDVVILDEPTVGLDPIQIIEIRSLVKSLAEKHTVIVSSHILSEIRALCDQIVIIAKGRVVADGSPDELERTLAGPAVTTILMRAPEADARAALEGVRGIERMEVAPTRERGTVEIRLEARRGIDIRERVFFSLAAANMPVVEMSTRTATLEDVFVKLATEAARESDVAADAAAATGEDGKEDADEGDLPA